jgi:hypothetical protein
MGGATTGAPRALDLRGTFRGSSRPRSQHTRTSSTYIATRAPPRHGLTLKVGQKWGGGSSDVLQGAVGSLHAGPVARGGHAAVPSPHVRGSRSQKWMGLPDCR